MSRFGSMASFPKSATSVREWLGAINLVRACPRPAPQARQPCRSPQRPAVLFLWLRAFSLCDARRWRAQAQYAEAFEAANIQVSQLHSLTDDDLKQLGLMEGQKRRLVRPCMRAPSEARTMRPTPAQTTRAVCDAREDVYPRAVQLIALEHLDVGGDVGEASCSSSERLSGASAAPQPKYNSTSSLYIDSTISRPCTDEIIFCVSIVIHDRIDEGEREARLVPRLLPLRPPTVPCRARSRAVALARTEHDPCVACAQLLADPTMVERMPDMFNTRSKPLLVQLDSSEPTEHTIFQSIKTIYSIAEFSAECLVISLLYIERLRSLTGLHMLMQNWQPITLAAMVVAQKVTSARSAPPPAWRAPWR